MMILGLESIRSTALEMKFWDFTHQRQSRNYITDDDILWDMETNSNAGST